MTEPNRMEPSVGSPFRGRFVKWPQPGVVVSGMVTHINLEGGRTDLSGNKRSLLQIHDPNDGDHGSYRRIELTKKALCEEVYSCIRIGMKPGWWIHLTYVENVPNQKAGHYPWKRFKVLYAKPTMSEEEVFDLVVGGRRPVQQMLFRSPVVPTEPYNSGSPSRVGACVQCP